MIRLVLLVHWQSLVITTVCLDEDSRANDFLRTLATGGLRRADVAVCGPGEGIALSIAPDAFGDGSTVIADQPKVLPITR